MRYVQEGQTVRVYDTVTPTYSQYVTAQSWERSETTTSNHGNKWVRTVVELVIAPSPYLSTAFVTEIYQAKGRRATTHSTSFAQMASATGAAAAHGGANAASNGGVVVVQTGAAILTGSGSGNAQVGANGDAAVLPVAAPTGIPVQANEQGEQRIASLTPLVDFGEAAGNPNSVRSTVMAINTPAPSVQGGVEGVSNGGANGGVLVDAMGLSHDVEIDAMGLTHIAASGTVRRITRGTAKGSAAGIQTFVAQSDIQGGVNEHVNGGAVVVQSENAAQSAQGAPHAIAQGSVVAVQTASAGHNGAHGSVGRPQRVTNVRVVAAATTTTSGSIVMMEVNRLVLDLSGTSYAPPTL